MRTFDQGTHGTDAREVIADTTTATHGLGSLGNGGVDTRVAILDFQNCITHRLHEAVDESGLDVGTSSTVDAAGGNEAVDLSVVEAIAPEGLIGLLNAQCFRLGFRK